MKFLKRKHLFTGIASFFAMLLVFFISCVLYVYFTVPGLFPISSILDEEDLAYIYYDKASLEAESFVKKSELESFYLFSLPKISFEEWLEELLDKGVFSEVPGERELLRVEEDFTLPSLSMNRCEEIYCYQRRLSFDQIPSIFWKALISIEDYRFIDHPGIDFFSILRAFYQNIKNGRFVEGGSTLTQQIVKNLFVGSEKTLTRKFKEILYSLYLETLYSKDELLEVYLNEAYFGTLHSMKFKGVEAASIFYFGKKSDELLSYEVSILISLLKGPNFYHPLRQTQRLKERADFVFSKLAHDNIISTKIDRIWDADEWKAFQKKLNDLERFNSYYALWKVLKSKQTSLKLYETFVFEKKAQDLLIKIKKDYPKRDLAIKAQISRPFEERDDSYFYYSKYERNILDAMTKERNAIGSIMKPVLYNIFLDHGHSLFDKVSQEPMTLSLLSGDWSPREAHEVLPPYEETTLIEALWRSDNNPVIRLSHEIGFDLIEEGLTPYLGPLLKRPLGEFPAQLLGAIELSLGEVYQMYKTFLKKECESPRDDNVLFLMSDPTQTTVRRRVLERLSTYRFFGKTGTSNSGFDNWYVFFDGHLLGVIWVGLEGIREGDLPLYGSNTAFDVFQYFVRDRGRKLPEVSCDDFLYKD